MPSVPDAAGTPGRELPPAIGRYRPEAVLGAGAMGIVYRAHDPAVDRPVAIKVMRTETLDTPTRAEYLERFRAEVRAAARCMHPAVVAIYDFCDGPAEPYIVMELIEGLSLARLLRDAPSRNVTTLAAMMLQVLQGLGAAHAIGVVHRDIKPANIMLSLAGQAKITDFGIARLGVGTLTSVGEIIGTPNYMAPEQALGQPVDLRADLFAVAAVLYEIYAGKAPFASATLSEAIYRLTQPDPVPLEPIRAVGAAAIAPLLRRGLAKKPADRFQSAQEFAASLRAVLGIGVRAAEAMPDAATLVMPGTRTATMAGNPARTMDFDPQLLRRLEGELARYLGPVAQTIIRRSAARATTLEHLHRLLAEALDRPEDRATFARHCRAGPSGTLAARTETGGLPMAKERFQLSDPTLLAAEETLAFFLGPIAKVLVRKAASQARSAVEFENQLAASVMRPDEAAEFRRRLRTRAFSTQVAR